VPECAGCFVNDLCGWRGKTLKNNLASDK